MQIPLEYVNTPKKKKKPNKHPFQKNPDSLVNGEELKRKWALFTCTVVMKVSGW